MGSATEFSAQKMGVIEQATRGRAKPHTGTPQAGTFVATLGWALMLTGVSGRFDRLYFPAFDLYC